MKERLNPALARLFSIDLLLAAALCIVAFAVFGIIANEILLQKKIFFDARAFDALSPYISPGHTKLALAITFFGSGGFLFPLYIVIILYLSLTKRRKDAIMIAAVVLASLLLGYILKEVFQRPRPLLAHLTGAEGYSFPSGHTAGAFTLCGILLYLLWKTTYKTPLKIVLSLALFLFAALVGLSRVYLHVHYASDVIGSFCVTVVWLGLFFIGTELLNTGNKPGDKI